MVVSRRVLVCECGTCKRCRNRSWMREHYRRNAATVRAERSAYRISHPDRVKTSSQGVRDRFGRFPESREQARARDAVRRLEKQPCSECGSTEKPQAHHEDYSKPLDVIWLCQPCHAKLHRRF